jgi:hypothetical protein
MCLAAIALATAALVSCDTYHKSADGSTFYASFGTDNDAVVIDGEMPSIAGWMPQVDKKGVIIGYKPAYSANPQTTGAKVGFAKLGSNQSTTGTRFLAEARNFGLGWVAGEVSKAADSNKAANEARQIDANAATEKTRLANEAARDAQRHTENMAEMETLSAIPTP